MTRLYTLDEKVDVTMGACAAAAVLGLALGYLLGASVERTEVSECVCMETADAEVSR